MTFSATQKSVMDLFVAAYGRAPTLHGLNFFANKVDNDGWSLRDVANFMFDTEHNPEAATRYPDTGSTEDKVKTVFEHVLGRPPATEKGLNFWVNRVDSNNGYTLADLVFDVINAAKTNDDAATLDAKRAAVEYFLEKVPADEQAGNQIQTDSVKDDATLSAAKAQIDELVSTGKTFDLTPGVDAFIGTEKNDTFNATSTTLGTDDIISDPSTKDSDTMNITLTANMPDFTAVNVENINVNLNTLGGTVIDADNIVGSTITVSSNKFGFSGAAEIDNLANNNAVAGENVTQLTVKGIKSGTIDAGSATKIIAETASSSNSISLKVHGDVALDAQTNDYEDLKIDADKDAVVDISKSTKNFTNAGEITGSGNVTIKTDVAKITGQEVNNKGTGELTVELTDSTDVNLIDVDTDKVITDVAFTKEIEYGKGALDITAKENKNVMSVKAQAPDTSGGSTPNSVTIHLEKEAVATTDKYNTTNITELTIDAQKGGTIAEIDNGNKTTNVTLIAGDDLTVTNLDAKDHNVTIDGSSEGDVELKAVQAAVVSAAEFKNDLTVTQSDDEDISIVGGKGKNTITTKATDKTVSIRTQDAADTIDVNTVTSGKLTINAGGGNDTVKNATSLNGTSSIDLGAGDDIIDHLKGGKDADITVLGGDGKDNVTIDKDSKGKITADMGAGDDKVDLSQGVDASAKINLSMGDGDDTILVKAAGAETLTFDGGKGDDVVSAVNASDFSSATLSFNDIEKVKVDTKVTFKGDQLSGQTFEVEGTGGDDQVIVKISSQANHDKTTDLSTVDFNNTIPHGIEYVDIDASKADGNDTIKAAKGVVNHIKLGAGKDVVVLSEDSLGKNVVDVADDGLTTGEVKVWDTTNAKFNIAVIESFSSADDSLILGDAATTSNYRDIDIDTNIDDTNKGKDIVKLVETAIAKAEAEMADHTDVEYVYAYNTNSSSKGSNSVLLWDTDGDHKVDGVILLVGINAQDAFDHTDIIASS